MMHSGGLLALVQSLFWPLIYAVCLAISVIRIRNTYAKLLLGAGFMGFVLTTGTMTIIFQIFRGSLPIIGFVNPSVVIVITNLMQVASYVLLALGLWMAFVPMKKAKPEAQP